MSTDEGQGMNSSQETLTSSADGPPEVTSEYSCTSRGDASPAAGQRVHNDRVHCSDSLPTFSFLKRKQKHPNLTGLPDMSRCHNKCQVRGSHRFVPEVGRGPWFGSVSNTLWQDQGQISSGG